MNRRAFLEKSLACSGSALLAGCDALSVKHIGRFKLTAEGEVGGRPSKASTVFEIKWRDNGIFASLPGEIAKWQPLGKGDALIWDMGDRGLVIGLLGSVGGVPQIGFRMDATDLSYLLTAPQKAGSVAAGEDGSLFDEYANSTIRAALPSEFWPVLMKVSDKHDRSSFTLLDPRDLAKDLGDGTRLNGIFLEATKEPISRGISEQLPFLKEEKKTTAYEKLRGVPMKDWPIWMRVNHLNFVVND